MAGDRFRYWFRMSPPSDERKKLERAIIRLPSFILELVSRRDRWSMGSLNSTRLNVFNTEDHPLTLDSSGQIWFQPTNTSSALIAHFHSARRSLTTLLSQGPRRGPLKTLEGPTDHTTSTLFIS